MIVHIIINSLATIILSFSAICLCDHNYITFSICLIVGAILQILNEYFIIHKLAQSNKKNTYKIKGE